MSSAGDNTRNFVRETYNNLIDDLANYLPSSDQKIIDIITKEAILFQ